MAISRKPIHLLLALALALGPGRASPAAPCARPLASLAYGAKQLHAEAKDYWGKQFGMKIHPKTTKGDRRLFLSYYALKHLTKVLFAPTIAGLDIVIAPFRPLVSLYHYNLLKPDRPYPLLARVLLTPLDWAHRNLPHLLLYVALSKAGVYVPLGFFANDDDYLEWVKSFDVPADFDLPENDRPDLYLDGDALAGRLAPWILSHTEPERRNKIFKSSLFAALYSGNPFHDRSYPPRQRLAQWIDAQPNRSITPVALYQAAIDATEGDVEEAMTVVWDELREGWTKDPERNFTARARKFVDITGEIGIRGKYPKASAGMPFRIARLGLRSSLVRVPGPKSIRGDNYSAWYHFAGTALLTYINGHRGGFPTSPTISSSYAKALVWLEEDLLCDEFVDPHKRKQIDLAGIRFGADLAAYINQYPSREAFLRDHPDASARDYLYDNPKVYGAKWRLPKGERPWNFKQR